MRHELAHEVCHERHYSCVLGLSFYWTLPLLIDPHNMLEKADLVDESSVELSNI